MRRVPVILLLLLAACGGDPIQDDIDRQLRENRQSLPNDHASEKPVERRTLAQFIDDYQDAGFFRGENPAVAARRITRDFEREWGETPPLATRLDELTLLRYDAKRVWFEDLERDVIDGNDAYVEAFDEWSRISRGAFRPRDVQERWAGEDGPVTIAFDLDGKRHQVQAAGQGDFLDLCVLTAGINPLIAGSGRQFAVYRPDAGLGQEAFVVALTPRERAMLERRGWAFATPEEVRLAFGYGQLYEKGAPSPC